MAERKTNQDQVKKTDQQAAASTQAYLHMSEFKDGVLVMKDGSLRAVLLCSSVNFALKSADEQDGIIYSYQRFLNSLTFPIQILVQSRRLDLEYYLEKLSKKADEQQLELVKLQILEYTEFIKRLISVTNIMDKRFLVVVPLFPEGAEAVKGFAKLFSGGGKKQENKQLEKHFQESKVQLMQRVEAIASGLSGMGLRAATLNSEELVELFYGVYNPSTSTKQRIDNADQATGAIVRFSGERFQAPADQDVEPAPVGQPAPVAPAAPSTTPPTKPTATANQASTAAPKAPAAKPAPPKPTASKPVAKPAAKPAASPPPPAPKTAAPRTSSAAAGNSTTPAKPQPASQTPAAPTPPARKPIPTPPVPNQPPRQNPNPPTQETA